MADLTVLAVRNAQPREKMYRLAAGNELYLQVMPTGAKYWRLKYRFAGSSNMLALGVFPEVSLAQAREARDSARRLLASGVDPNTHRRVQKRALIVDVENNLEAVVREWYALRKPEWAETYAERFITAMERDIFPWLGSRTIGTIEPRDLLVILQKIQQRGAKETAHRLRRWLSQIFRYAIIKGVAPRDPAADLKGALQAIDNNNFPTLTDPDRIGEMMRAIDGYSGTYITRAALTMAPLVFTRPGELRFAQWPEFDLDKAEWHVPAIRLKMRKAQKAKSPPHIVPLSRQVVQILRDLLPLTGTGVGRFLFPGARTATRPMSENTLNAALHRLGFKGEIVAHGFRHMASTALNEAGWSADAIERQLAHKDKDSIRSVYNKAQYMDERRKMMQAWADYLDKLRATVPVTRPRLAA